MSIVKIKVLHQKFGETFKHEKKGYGLVIVKWCKLCVQFIFISYFPYHYAYDYML